MLLSGEKSKLMRTSREGVDSAGVAGGRIAAELIAADESESTDDGNHLPNDEDDENYQKRSKDEEDADEDDDDDDWGVVSIDRSDSGHLGRTGVLILSGDEDECEEYVGRIRIDEVYRTAADLSLPGTDSIPTDPGTLGGDDDGTASFRPRIREVITTSQQTLTSAHPHAHQQHHHHPLPPSDAKARRAPGFPERPRSAPKRPLAVMVLITLAIVLPWISLTLYLARDRSAWRSKTEQLEKEIKELKELHEQYKRRTRASTMLPPPRATWEDSCNNPASQMTVLDNCWLHAKASVKLGECASEAHQTMVNWSASLAETADAVGKAIWNAALIWSTPPANATDAPGNFTHSHHSTKKTEPVTTPVDLKNYFSSMSIHLKKAANNLKSIGPLFDQTATAAFRGIDEATKAALAAGATAGEAVMAASEMASDMMDDIMEVAREVVEEATKTSRLSRER